QHPDLLSRGDRRVSDRDASWWWFGRGNCAINGRTGPNFLRLAGKEGSHMPVLTHAQKNNIDYRLACVGVWDNPLNFGGSTLRSLFRRLFAKNAVDLIRLNSQRSKQKLLGHAKIAFRIA